MYAQNILTANLAPMPSDGQPAQTIWEWGYDGVEVGIWECAPGTISGQTGDFDEAMCMVSGRVTVEHDGGAFDISSRLGVGDATAMAVDVDDSSDGPQDVRDRQSAGSGRGARRILGQRPLGGARQPDSTRQSHQR